jgi:hypothetical protein
MDERKSALWGILFGLVVFVLYLWFPSHNTYNSGGFIHALPTATPLLRSNLKANASTISGTLTNHDYHRMVRNLTVGSMCPSGSR